MPEILATAGENASVTVVHATDVNGTARVMITPENGNIAKQEVYTIPVSYTHLDVYKRQPEYCITIRMTMAIVDCQVTIIAITSRMATVRGIMSFQQRQPLR